MPTSKQRSGKALPNWSSPVPVRHRRGDRDDLRIARGFGDQRVGEHFGVGGRVGLGLRLRAGDDVEGGDAVILVVGGLGRRVALALLGHDVDQHRPAARVAHVLQDRQQVVEVVAVDGADVIEAQLLEQGAAGRRSRGRIPRLRLALS